MSLIVKAGKMGKRVLKKFLPEEKHHVSYTRRIERVHTKERVVAMTFDDGPMDLPSSPDKFGGRALTDFFAGHSAGVPRPGYLRRGGGHQRKLPRPGRQIGPGRLGQGAL